VVLRRAVLDGVDSDSLELNTAGTSTTFEEVPLEANVVAPNNAAYENPLIVKAPLRPSARQNDHQAQFRAS
jgi:hypothetical protein